MRINGTPDEIIATMIDSEPGCLGALAQARTIVQQGKQQIYPYQAACLYKLARQYAEGRILEIGTYYGYSAMVMAIAAPKAKIITLGIHPWECDIARENLANYPNVSVVQRPSWEYLEMLAPDWMFDMIFVDGDHKQIRRDFPYWNRLKVGGLMFFHDFSPNGSGRPCPPAYRGILSFEEFIGRKFDILIVDDQNVGMAGYYKQAEDRVWAEYQ